MRLMNQKAMRRLKINRLPLKWDINKIIWVEIFKKLKKDRKDLKTIYPKKLNQILSQSCTKMTISGQKRPSLKNRFKTQRHQKLKIKTLYMKWTNFYQICNLGAKKEPKSKNLNQIPKQIQLTPTKPLKMKEFQLVGFQITATSLFKNRQSVRGSFLIKFAQSIPDQNLRPKRTHKAKK